MGLDKQRASEQQRKGRDLLSVFERNQQQKKKLGGRVILLS